MKEKNNMASKEQVKEMQNNNLVEIVDKSGVEMAVGKLVEQNSSLLPSNTMVERIKNSAGFYISNRKDLMGLDREGKLQMLYGVLKEAMVGCEAGTDFDIIPFKNKPTIIRNKNGYFKIIDMIKPAEIVRFTNNVVIKGDEFEFNPVTEEIKHIPKVTSDKYEDIEYAYAYIKFANGFEKTIVMSKKDLDTIKKVSPSGNTQYSPWTTMPIKMVKTKVVKELAKELITLFSGKLTSNMVNAINSDEQVVSRVDEKGYVENDDTIYEPQFEEKPKETKKVSLDDIE